MNQSKESVLAVIVGVLFTAAVFSAIVSAFAAVFRLIYNAVVPGIFHVGPVLTFGQALLVWLFIGFIAGVFRRSK